MKKQTRRIFLKKGLEGLDAGSVSAVHTHFRDEKPFCDIALEFMFLLLHCDAAPAWNPGDKMTANLFWNETIMSTLGRIDIYMIIFGDLVPFHPSPEEIWRDIVFSFIGANAGSATDAFANVYNVNPVVVKPFWRIFEVGDLVNALRVKWLGNQYHKQPCGQPFKPLLPACWTHGHAGWQKAFGHPVEAPGALVGSVGFWVDVARAVGAGLHTISATYATFLVHKNHPLW